MSVLAPPDTHYLDGEELEPDDVADLEDDRPCHVLDYEGDPLCGADGSVLGVVHTTPDPLASPCSGGCGRARCRQCAAVLEELGG